jgi:hypothetical protein
VKLKRAGDGIYETQDERFEVQNAHRMDPNDPDRSWYVLDNSKPLLDQISGPFDTLRECREWIEAHTVDPSLDTE